ncbi:MAG: LURP-one-related family protein [Deltaproteobacteria bacterium]|nr:LURP-one-related family protein [Deltaproteobacteria bacterium]
MPTYTIRSRLISICRCYSIETATGEIVFRLVGKVRFARTFVVKDRAGALLLSVRERLLKLDPTYEITQGTAQVAVVRRHTTSGALVDRFTIDLNSQSSMAASDKLWTDDGVRDGL